MGSRRSIFDRPTTIGVFWLAALASGLHAADDYRPGPDSFPQAGVPKGELRWYTFDHSKIFPGTVRKYAVYIPAQYRGDRPACLFFTPDSVALNAPVVFDNLIARKEIPILIGVFATPGAVPAANRAKALNRANRSYEYDGMSDNYVRFLLDELLPEVETKPASDGRPVRISSSPDDRAVGGESSGAICAFTVAWERPESFHRVFSAVGTFVGLRGGEVYPTLIRKTEPKPLRLFLQDGSNDHNFYGGDFWMANQTMERALVFAGYEVNHAWGDGGHTAKQATQVFPEAMRWLWRGWPAPVPAGTSGNEMLGEILIPGEGWRVAAEGLAGSDGPAVNARGELFFSEVRANKIWKIGLDGRRILFASDAGHVSGEAFGPDGRLYTVSTKSGRLVSYDPDGHPAVIAEGLSGHDLAVAHNGNIYVTDPPPSDSNAPSKVWLVRPGGARQVVDIGLRCANGIALCPDQSLLYVGDWRSHWVYSYFIQPDGTLADKQRYFDLQQPDSADQSDADGLRVDRAGRLYVSTNLGVQVCDQAGRVNAILPMPNRQVSNLSFGGPNFETLYATSGDILYARRLRSTGANGWAEPNKPAPPKT